MKKINLLFFKINHAKVLAKDIIEKYRPNVQYNVEHIEELPTLIKSVADYGNGVFIFELSGKEDLQFAVAILKKYKKLVNEGFLRPACILRVSNKKVEKVLGKYGCVDFLDEKITTRSLSFKIDFWSKGITKSLDKAEKELEYKNKKSVQVKKEAVGAKENFVFTAPLDLKSDFWIIKAKNDCKKILRRWLIKALAPSPHVGKWFELETKPGRIQTWKYVPRDIESREYVADDGAWFFCGDKPEFDWKAQRWNFSSDAPHLYFYSRSEEVFSRFKFFEGQVHVAKNSAFALTREEAIIKTCDSKFNFEGELAEEAGKEELEGGEAKVIDASSLKGELDDLAHEDSSAARGSLEEDITEDSQKEKSSYSEDDLGGTLRGDVTNKGESEIEKSKKTNFKEEELGNLVGSLKEVDLENNLENKKEGNDVINSFPDKLSGKGESGDLGESHLSGKLREGEAEREEANKSQRNSKVDQLGPLSGKGSADEIDGNPLSGKTSTDEIDNGPLSGKGSADEIDGNPLSGKTSTDEIDNGPLSGKGSADEIDGNPLSGKTSTDEIDNGPLSGKGSADEIDGNPLSGKTSTDEIDNGPLSGKGSADEIDGNPLSGKTSTDEINNGPLSGKGSADEIDGNPLSGKTSTDEIDNGPLSGALNPQSSNKSSEDNLSEVEEEKKKESKEELADYSLDANLEKKAQEVNELDPFGKKEKRIDPLEGIQAFAQAEGEESSGDSDAPIGEILLDNEKSEAREENDDLSFDDEKKKSSAIEYDLAEKIKSEAGVDASLMIGEASSVEGKPSSKKENDMYEALGGGLTDGDRGQDEESTLDLNTVLDSKRAEVNLESGELRVILKQVTEAGNSITFICDFEDFYEDELVVMAPKNSLLEKTSVEAAITLSYAGQKVKVICRGTIDTIESYDEFKDTLGINLIEIDKKKYESFITLYQDRQYSISDFMEKAKGY